MADYNSFSKTILVGRVATEVKTRDSKKGTKMAWFQLATNEVWPGEKTPHVEYHRIICFGKKAELMIEYGTKGLLIVIEGKPRHRSWKNDKGEMRSMSELNAEGIIFLGPKKEKSKPSAKDKESFSERQKNLKIKRDRLGKHG
jgi:single-strand DNA-binding protein